MQIKLLQTIEGDGQIFEKSLVRLCDLVATLANFQNKKDAIDLSGYILEIHFLFNSIALQLENLLLKFTFFDVKYKNIFETPVFIKSNNKPVTSVNQI